MKHDATQGTIGILATFGSLAISHADINAWLTTISLLVGIAVGTATLISIIRKNHKHKK